MGMAAFMLAVIPAQAKKYSETIYLNLSLKGSMAEAFNQIEQKSEFRFFYDESVVNVNQTIILNTENQTIEGVLDKVFEGTNISYRVYDRYILVYPRGSKDADVAQLLPAAPSLQQQSSVVKGKVVDDKGEGLPMASVMLKGTSNVTLTDVEGNYSITIPPSAVNPVLVFSFIGFETKEELVGSKSTIDVTLAGDVSQLEEIVVVGYGVQKKGSVTGSVAQISGKELLRAPVADITNSVVGRLPGIRAVNRSGEPGYSSADLDVRGFGSALIIVDGIPSDFSQLDPNEIESISTLKDASAAVYGVKAANGVILVTTKRGKTGITRINFNANMGWQTPTRYPKLVNAGEFVELVDEDAINRGQMPVYGQEQLENWRNEVDEDHQSTDWYKQTIREFAPQKQYNMNISGGKDSLRYFASVGYLDQGSMWQTGDTRFHRYNFRTNVDAKLKGGLSTTIMLSGRQENREFPYSGAGNIMSSIIRNYPTYAPFVKGNRNYFAETNQPHQNSLVLINKEMTGYTRQRNNVFEGAMTLLYEAPFLEGLNAKAMYTHRIESTAFKQFRKEYELYKWNEAEESFDVSYIGNSPSMLTQTSFEYHYSVFQGSVNYAKTIAGKHDFDLLFLVETREADNNWFKASREFTIDALDEMFAGISKNKDNDGSSSTDVYANIGYVGRLNYAYDKKYLFEFSFRYDGSAKFPAENRWGFFPSLSGGWRMTEEDFIKYNGIKNVLTDLKLRASWGRLGDDEASSYQFLTGYVLSGSNYMLGDELTAGLVSKGLANRNITWYTSDLTNLGVDFSLWRGLLSGEFDVFYRKRNGLLATRALSLPGTFGASLPAENLNSDSDRGFELMLRHKNQLRNGITYSIAANVSETRSKWGYVERATPTNQYENWKNSSTNRWKNRWWGYTATGQFQSYEEISKAPVQDGKGNNTLRPGDIRYLDYNGDGIIDDNDTHAIGRGAKPEIMFGFDLAIAWKNVDISVFFQGAANFNAYFTDELQSPLMNGASSFRAFTDRWHRADLYDPNSAWIPGKYPSTYAGGLESNRKVSTFWMQNATYIRLKDLQIGYTFSPKLMKKVGIDYLRVYASGFNLLTVTGLKLLDPEAPSGRGAYYPQQKIYTFGLNLTL